MRTVEIVEMDASSAELDSAAVLFDRYRGFYGRPSNLPLAQHYLRERLQAGESTVLLARLEAQWVGFCQLYRGFSSISCASVAILNDLYVEVGHRGAGVGRALIARAIELARQRHAACVVLETAVTNARARALYEQVGFQRARGFVGYSMGLRPAGETS